MSDRVTLLDNTTWSYPELKEALNKDSFYYGYLNKAALSSSSAKILYQSAKSYHKSLNKKQEETKALRDGRLFHTLVLESDIFFDKYAVVDSSTRTTQKFKEVELKEEKEVILEKEYFAMLSLYENVRRCDDVIELFKGGKAEVPNFGFIMNLPFRCKADYLTEGGIVDLKTTISLKGWEYQAKNVYHYDMQAYIYSKIFGVDYFTFVVVEKGSGDILVSEVSKETLQQGKDKTEIVVDKYMKYFYKKTEEQVIRDIFNDYKATII